MQPEQRDAAHLWDMLDAARGVLSLIQGMSEEDYLSDRRTQLAVEREVEVIGEAAGRVSRMLQEAHPQIPWRKIIAQRHVLAHEYGTILQDRMWAVASIHVPELISELEPLIPPIPPGTGSS